jgi:hypothetical protein
MDRNLAFFIELKDRLGAGATIASDKNKTAFSSVKAAKQPPRDSGKLSAIGNASNSHDHNTGLDTDGDYMLDDPDYKEKVKTKVLLSNFQHKTRINYRPDDSNNKSNNTIISSGENMQDTSLTSIIEWSNKHQSTILSAMDFAYLKNFQYPANRMVVLRRFGETGALHNVLQMAMKPTSTLVGYIDPSEETAFTISYNEKWEASVKTGFIDVINSITSFKELYTKFPTFDGQSNLEQAIAMRVGEAFGITNSKENPVGDPDVLHEAAIRKTGAMEAGNGYNGLDSRYEIKFQTEYEQKYIAGVDPGVAMLDIIGNAIRMGTSDSKFVMTGGATNHLRELTTLMAQGRTSEVIARAIDAIKGVLSNVAGLMSSIMDEVIGTAASYIEQAQEEGLKKTGEQVYADSKSAFTKVFTTLVNEMNQLVAITVRKYQWPLRGALAAMSGTLTAPWHITMGNPKAPWFSSGNLICNSLELNFGNELGFNDMPTTLKVTADLVPGRNLGGQEIETLFNTAKGRIYLK